VQHAAQQTQRQQKLVLEVRLEQRNRQPEELRENGEFVVLARLVAEQLQGLRRTRPRQVARENLAGARRRGDHAAPNAALLDASANTQIYKQIMKKTLFSNYTFTVAVFLQDLFNKKYSTWWESSMSVIFFNCLIMLIDYLKVRAGLVASKMSLDIKKLHRKTVHLKIR